MILQARDISKATLIINGDTTITPDSDAKFAVVSESDIILNSGTQAGITLSFITQNSCTVTYTDINGNSKTDSFEEGSYFIYNYEGSYWVGQGATAVTGIDDNGQPFAFNIQSLAKSDGIINLTGTDANGNPFDYGLGKLVLAADEDNLVTGVEVKTSKTYNGKPIYKRVFSGTTASDATQKAVGEIPNMNYCISLTGSVITSTQNLPVNWYWDTTVYIGCFVQKSDNNTIYIKTPSTAYQNKSVYVVVEYTKTTD